MKSQKLLIAISIIVCAFCVLLIIYLIGQSGGNGEFYIDNKGVAHGSGIQQYFYESTELKLEEEYVNGQLRVSNWYLPDGSLFESTSWKNGTGTGYYLRDNGSVRMKQQYVNGIAHGETVYFMKDGSIDKIVEFHEGNELSEDGNGS